MKTSGIGDRFFVDGYDLSGDVGVVRSVSGTVATQDITILGQTGRERRGLLRDGLIEFDAFFNNAAGASHAILKLLPTTNIVVSYFRGITRGYPSASMYGLRSIYDVNRGKDGDLLLSSNVMSDGYGLEWGVQLTAGKETVVGNNNLIPRGLASSSIVNVLTSVDTAQPDGNPRIDGIARGLGIPLSTAITSFGASAFIHVTNKIGGILNIVIEHSTDNATFSTITGLEFSALTTGNGYRLMTDPTLTIQRYIRAKLTGTFTSATIAVSFARKYAR